MAIASGGSDPAVPHPRHTVGGAHPLQLSHRRHRAHSPPRAAPWGTHLRHYHHARPTYRYRAARSPGPCLPIRAVGHLARAGHAGVAPSAACRSVGASVAPGDGSAPARIAAHGSAGDHPGLGRPLGGFVPDGVARPAMAASKVGFSCWLGLMTLLWSLHPVLFVQSRGVIMLTVVTGGMALVGWLTGVQFLVVWSGGLG